jgi:hypothetical protein
MIGFCTIFPPNSPSCIRDQDLGSWGIYSATSEHSGGINGVLVDDSVRFFSNTINCGNLSIKSKPKEYFANTSPFGVWGALGSLSGGESLAP